MAIAITVEDNSSAIKEIFKRLVDIGSDLSPLYDEIGAEGVASTQNRFLGGFGVDGNPWKVSWRASMQGRNGIGVGETMRDTNRLMNSYTHNVLSSGVEWGTGVAYAAPLHFGATILPKNGQYITFAVGGQYRKVKKVVLEPRTQLGINAEDEESILNIIGGFIDDVLRGT